MVEEKLFARKASGLVRGLSLTDAFLVAFMNQGLTVSVWVTISLGLSVYTGGNLVLAALISLVLAGISMPLVWGILGGSMPRSGGTYIYNSRILHPLVGIAQSFSDAFVWVMWIYLLAPWTMDPGMVTLFRMLGMPQAAAWCSSQAGLIIGATVVNLLAFTVLVFGVKFFARAQRVVVGLAMVGALAVLLVFALTPPQNFRANWTCLQERYASGGTVRISLTDLLIDPFDSSARLSALESQLLGRTTAVDLLDPRTGRLIAPMGNTIDEATLEALIPLVGSEPGQLSQVEIRPLDYDAYVTAVRGSMEQSGKTLPVTWNWLDTLGVMVAASWLFLPSYCITYIAGEVKRPDRNLLLGNLFAVLIPGIYMVLLALCLYNTVGFSFLSATAWVDQTGTAIAGYTLPWSPSYLGLAGVITQNPLVVFLMAFSFVLFNIWYVALSYLVFPRILFAWGLDRMGPRWMADINPRWATPVKNYLAALIIGEIGIVLYSFFRETMSSLTVSTLQVVTVFGVTAVAAALFPFLKKVRHIWEASPYRSWKFLRIPAVTWGAAVFFVYLVFIFVFYEVMPGYQKMTLPSLLLFAGIWALGSLWYFYWKWRNKRSGVDMRMTYGELPPD